MCCIKNGICCLFTFFKTLNMPLSTFLRAAIMLLFTSNLITYFLAVLMLSNADRCCCRFTFFHHHHHHPPPPHTHQLPTLRPSSDPSYTSHNYIITEYTLVQWHTWFQLIPVTVQTVLSSVASTSLIPSTLNPHF